MYSDTPNSTVLALHPASCDQGLAMTSSFTSMVIAAQALGFLASCDAYLEHVFTLCELGSDILARAVQACEAVDWNHIRRGCLLANGDLNGAAMEGALKMLEMTDGRIATISNSFLGVRHGPLSFLDPHTLVLYFISTQSRWRRYELDLIKEVQNKDLGGYRIAVGCDLAECEGLVEERIEIPAPPDGLADDLRPPLDVLVPQVLALRLGLAAGLNPDNPSRRGAISRVVQGVTIHGISGT
jgi:tagatose-6-phosphate ketose/aldose isomerase